jgi:hypothetical protein
MNEKIRFITALQVACGRCWIQAEQKLYPFSTIERSSIVSLSDEYEMSVSLLVSSATSVWHRDSSEAELLIGLGASNSVTQLKFFAAAHCSFSSSSTSCPMSSDVGPLMWCDKMGR